MRDPGLLMSAVDVFLIHGVEGKMDVKTSYTPLVESIRRKLPLDFEMNVHPIDYCPLLEGREEEIYQLMKPFAGWGRLLELGCKLIGDVLAFAPPEKWDGTPGNFYYDLYAMLCDTYDQINAIRPDSKKVIIAHSLGTEVSIPFGFRRKIDALFTMGSPILFFSLRFKDGGKCPEIPVFHNFWRKYDPVGPSPLSIKDPFKGVQDHQVKSLDPRHIVPILAHTSFWTDDFVAKTIAAELLKLC